MYLKSVTHHGPLLNTLRSGVALFSKVHMHIALGRIIADYDVKNNLPSPRLRVEALYKNKKVSTKPMDETLFVG